jgi:hypothetical protein
MRADSGACPFRGETVDEAFRARTALVAPPDVPHRAWLRGFRPLAYMSIAAYALASATMLADCGPTASGGNSIPNGSPGPPANLRYPPGVSFGGSCDGDVYFADGPGYLVCDNGTWDYTAEVPGDGYRVDPEYANFNEGNGSSSGSDTSSSTSGAETSGPASSSGSTGSSSASGDSSSK